MEISLAVAESYFKERIQELRAQVSHGTPTIFFGALAILGSLMAHTNSSKPSDLLGPTFTGVDSRLQFLIENLGYFYAIYQDGVPDGFTGQTTSIEDKLAFTHVDSLHMQTTQMESGRQITTLSATGFLNDLDEVVIALFELAEVDTLLAAKLFVSINTRKLFGYGNIT